jgi:hypothetical protein
MMETALMIPVGADVALEARLAVGRQPRAAVLCHPHPLYGGDMDNNVVTALRKVFHELGWGTLRFNFRGVGRSTGNYGEGAGEQQDLIAAVNTLLGSPSPLTFLCLAGYSFGAWIVLQAIQQELRPDALVLVSPPIDVLPFAGLDLPVSPCLITLGDSDSFCSMKSLEHWLTTHSPQHPAIRFELLPHTDHFYWGREERLVAITRSFITGLSETD